MAGNNHTPGIGFYTSLPDHEVEQRIAIVRRAKARLARELTDDELDALIPPTPCRRTRLRLMRKEALEQGRSIDHIPRG